MREGFTAECDITESEGKLTGYTISLKDAIWLKGIESHSSSAILRGFTPLEDATVTKKIKAAGGRIIGKTIQDEFGFGSYCVNVGQGFKAPKNPLDSTRVTGGSSGGAAVAAATIDKHIAIGESTGGSIVTPASFCGVVGLCPTYGRVSRSGLISYGASLDKIGLLAKTVQECALGLEVISGQDDLDETTSDVEVEEYTKADTVIKKIALLKVEGVEEHITKRIEAISKKLGVEVKEITLPFTKKYALAAYYIIAMSEASTHLAALCGMRYGASEKLTSDYNSYFTTVRSKYFGEEVKRRILLGTFTRMTGYRGKYYMKALQVRTKIIAEYEKIFQEYDAIIMPTTAMLAPKFDEVKKLTPAQIYASDFLTVGPNIAGLPHLSVPVQEEGLPFGLMIVGKQFSESTIISIGKKVEVLR